MYVVIGVALLLFICAIFLLFGKGSWLIAGYNTASKEEKEKYDEKKLCTSVGVFLLIYGVMLSLIAVINTEEFALAMILPMILVPIVEVVYANKCCKIK